MNYKSTKLVIIGKGQWGKALGRTFQSAFLDTVFLDSHSTSSDWNAALNKNCFIVIACPFGAIVSIMRYLQHNTVQAVMNASKGIDRKTLNTFSGMAEKQIKAPFATLSGPTFAAELLEQKPTAAVLASKDKKFLASAVQKLSTPYFRLYTSSDLRGVETCGAVKNVLAIACGISDGLSLGHNARAALLTRGLVEIQQLLPIFGGEPSTAYGLAGVGDLWLTATGDLSRNRQLGHKISQGILVSEALDQIGTTCEGFHTVAQVERIRKMYKLELPICSEVFQICYKGRDPRKSLVSLMTRELKAEESKSLKPLKKRLPKR